MDIVILIILIIVLIFLITALFGAPYVVTRKKELAAAFKNLRPLTKNDTLVDFGCGGGTVLRVAVEQGVGKAVGLEINPILALIARLKSRGNPKIKIKYGDMAKIKLPPDMSVVYIFGLDRVMKRLKPILENYAKEQGRAIDVISNAFEFENLKPAGQHGSFYLFKLKP